MATKRSSRKATRTTRTRYTYTAPYWMLQLSFWLVVIVGLIMVTFGILNALNSTFGTDWHWTWFERTLSYVKSICFTIAMIIPVCLSCRIAHHYGRTWFIIWIICVILVVVGIVTSLL